MAGELQPSTCTERASHSGSGQISPYRHYSGREHPTSGSHITSPATALRFPRRSCLIPLSPLHPCRILQTWQRQLNRRLALALTTTHRTLYPSHHVTAASVGYMVVTSACETPPDILQLRCFVSAVGLENPAPGCNHLRSGNCLVEPSEPCLGLGR